MKFCKDCKHVRRAKFFAVMSLGLSADQWKYAKCARTEMWKDKHYEMTSPRVRTGEYSYCAVEREFSCGTEAKFFEEKTSV